MSDQETEKLLPDDDEPEAEAEGPQGEGQEDSPPTDLEQTSTEEDDPLRELCAEFRDQCKIGDRSKIRRILDKTSTPEQLVHVLRSTGESDYNGLQEACIAKNIGAINVIFEYIEKLDRSLFDVDEFLLKKDESGFGYMHLACSREDLECKKGVQIDALEILYERVQSLDESLPGKLLFQTDTNKRSFLHVCCEFNNTTAIVVIAKLLKDDAEKLKALAKLQDVNGLNCLHYACAQGHKETIRMMLESFKGKFVVETLMQQHDNEGRVPLYYACVYFHREICADLVNTAHVYAPVLGSVLKEEDDNKMNLIHHAAIYGNADMIHCVTTQGALKPEMLKLFSAKDEEGLTPLAHACFEYNNDVIDEAFKNLDGSVLQSVSMIKDPESKTILHHICRLGLSEPLKVLTERRAALEQLIPVTDKNNETCLHQALHAGNLHYLQLLLSSIKQSTKQDILTIRNAQKKTAMHIACAKGFTSVVKLLIGTLKKGHFNRLCEIEDKNGLTPLHIACKYDQRDVVDLIAKNVDISTLSVLITEQRPDVKTAIQIAQDRQHFESIATILKPLIEKNHTEHYELARKVIDSLRKSVILEACQRGSTDALLNIIKVANWAYPNGEKYHELLLQRDCDFKTPLQIACVRGDKAMVQAILDHMPNVVEIEDRGPNIDARKESISTLDVPFRGGHWEPLDDDNTRTSKSTRDQNETILCNQDIQGRTALHLCCQQGDNQVLQLILDAASKSHCVEKLMCTADDQQTTALFDAFIGGDYNNVKHILSQAAENRCFEAVLQCTNRSEQTLFHIACRHKYSYVRCVEVLTTLAKTHGSLWTILKKQDSNMRFFLSYLAETNEDVLEFLIETITDVEDHDQSSTAIIHRILTMKDKFGKTVIQRAQEAHMSPMLHALLTQLRVKQKELGIVNYDLYTGGDTDSITTSDTMINAMIEARCLYMLNHKFTKEYLNQRWGRNHMVLFALTSILSLAFVVFLGIHVANYPETTDESLSFFFNVNTFLVLVLSIIFFLREVVLMIIFRRHYWTDSLRNYANCAVPISCVVLTVYTLFVTRPTQDWQHQFGVATFFVACLNAIWVLTKTLSFGNRICQGFGLKFHMVLRVAREVFVFCPVFVIFIGIFSLIFWFLFGVHTGTSVSAVPVTANVTVPEVSYFSNFGVSFLKIMTMTAGEFEVAELFFDGNLDAHCVVHRLIFVVFILIMTIAMMNLLVGIAVGDVNYLRARSQVLLFEDRLHIMNETHRILRTLRRFRSSISRDKRSMSALDTVVTDTEV